MGTIFVSITQPFSSSIMKMMEGNFALEASNSFSAALASLKAMLDIHSVIHVFNILSLIVWYCLDSAKRQRQRKAKSAHLRVSIRTNFGLVDLESFKVLVIILFLSPIPHQFTRTLKVDKSIKLSPKKINPITRQLLFFLHKIKCFLPVYVLNYSARICIILPTLVRADD